MVCERVDYHYLIYLAKSSSVNFRMMLVMPILGCATYITHADISCSVYSSSICNLKKYWVDRKCNLEVKLF